jgi:hypothetical protein
MRLGVSPLNVPRNHKYLNEPGLNRKFYNLPGGS